MKDDKLQTKRQTKKGIRVLHAKLSRKKQRVSAAADANSLDQDVPNVGVGRALTVILILHVVAISAIYIGTQWNKSDDLGDSSDKEAALSVDISNVNKALEHKFVQVGDTYEIFAKRHNVDVAELKDLNNNAQIYAGRKLAIPARKLSSDDPDAMRTAQNIHEGDQNGAVSDRPVIDTPETDVPKAVLIKPKRNPNVARAIPVVEASGVVYVVKGGDSVWRICNKFKVKQSALLELNKLSDPRKLREGMTLKIPVR